MTAAPAPRPLVTVVIPTFDRASELTTTISSLYASELRAPGTIELIVVDDGSARPAERFVDAVDAPGHVTRRVIRQPNLGVGSARNRGFAEARGPVVLFVDDDMILLPTTLQGHIDAHRALPGAVVFGRSPYVAQRAPTPFTAWVLGLSDEPDAALGEPDAGEPPVPAEMVASGHLSVERATVAGWGAFYSDAMRTPVAEEYELAHRLASEGIPAYRARGVVALHNRQVSLDAFLRQQHGHGKGCGEAARVAPASRSVGGLGALVDHHTRSWLRSLPWPVLRTRLGRRVLRLLARAADHRWAPPRVRSLAFTAASGAAFGAGARDGLRGR